MSHKTKSLAKSHIMTACIWACILVITLTNQKVGTLVAVVLYKRHCFVFDIVSALAHAHLMNFVKIEPILRLLGR